MSRQLLVRKGALDEQAGAVDGVSDDTLRRWADGGRIKTITDASGVLAVDGAELARLARNWPNQPIPRRARWGGPVGAEQVQRPGRPQVATLRKFDVPPERS